MILPLEGASSSASTLTLLPDYATSENSVPPRYWTHERPSMPLTYTFNHYDELSENAMILRPPAELANPFSAPPPEYTVETSLQLNPFLPPSYRTRVHRIGKPPSLRKDWIGEFEIAMNNKRAVLMMGNLSLRLPKVFTPADRSNRHWVWKVLGIRLRWDCRQTLEDGTILCICFRLDRQETQLATFVPPPMTASPPLPDPALTVFPDGHEVFDHILMSSLVVSRYLTM
ncbi:hypothetical protein CYLTODRAFT_380599 [Cylindrobasidium torrendii FP15055 ss-10]|uniref:Uncharacterized protein n=1 Tax=Cylindrobasidium torrendii FP15055 ss-10 TaxID=1314674 RepID=A0A0D7B378_9AGAR|nr:hypothetical protein CYLTODRAFT_380599 [Cylindrobasidium torrendii FP15055 ss-10]